MRTLETVYVLRSENGLAYGKHGLFVYTSEQTARIAARVLGKLHGRYYKVVRA